MLSTKKKIIISLATIVFVIFGIPFIATLISQARYELTKPPPLLRETEETTPIQVVIGDQELLIPANYFLNGYTKRDKKEQTAWIRAYWPDMKGATKETIARRKVSRGYLNEIIILIENVTKDQISGRRNLYKFWLNSKYDKYKEPKEKYGLLYHENNFGEDAKKKISMWGLKDLYVDNPEKPQAFIRCISKNVPNENISYPNCQHLFSYKLLRFRVTYSREYLPQWKEIQTKVIKLIDQFEKKSTETSSSTAGE